VAKIEVANLFAQRRSTGAVVNEKATIAGDQINPLRFTDQQLKMVQNAAALLPAIHRPAFLQSVANRLGRHHPEDSEVASAATFALALCGVAVRPALFRGASS
jgi:hypothetical protein